MWGRGRKRRLLVSLAVIHCCLLSEATYYGGGDRFSEAEAAAADYRYQRESPQPVLITPNNITAFDCDFEEGEQCLWTWEEDSYTRDSANWPGQHGFYRLSAQDVAAIRKTSKPAKAKFFGPGWDSRRSKTGKGTLPFVNKMIENVYDE